MIDYENNFFLVLRFKGSLVPKAFVCSIPSVAAAVVLHVIEEQDPGFMKDAGIDDITQGMLWNAMSVAIVLLLMFRSFQALGRFWEGTTLLHKMRGEWFDVATLCFAWSRDAKLNKKGFDESANEFRRTLTRLMSLMHGCALEEISNDEDDPATHYDVLDVNGLDRDTLRFLRDCREEYHFNTVEAIQHIIQVLITHNHHSGVLTIAPPILGRVYQSLSRGLVNLLNAKKIKDTMFPFPYAQTVLILLLVHSFFVPVMVTQVVDNKYFAASIAFPIIFAMFCVNFVAAELEMPFSSKHSNHLPLQTFQEEFNQCLLMLTHDLTDHLGHTCPQAIKDFNHLENFSRATLCQKTTKFAKRIYFESHSKSYNAPGFLDDHEAIENLPWECDTDDTPSPSPSAAKLSSSLNPSSRRTSKNSKCSASLSAAIGRKGNTEAKPSQLQSQLPTPPQPSSLSELQPSDLFSPGRSIPAEGDSADSRAATGVETDWSQQDLQRQLEVDYNMEELRRSTRAMTSSCTSFEEALTKSNDAMKEATASVLSFLQMPEQMVSTPMKDFFE